FLRVDGAGLDGGDRLGQVPAQRHGAKQLEGARLHVARQHADAHVLHVGGRADRAQLVRYLAKSVLVPAEDAIADSILDPAREELPELPVHRAARLIAPREQEWQVDKAELWNAAGQIA